MVTQWAESGSNHTVYRTPHAPLLTKARSLPTPTLSLAEGLKYGILGEHCEKLKQTINKVNWIGKNKLKQF